MPCHRHHTHRRALNLRHCVCRAAPPSWYSELTTKESRDGAKKSGVQLAHAVVASPELPSTAAQQSMTSFKARRTQEGIPDTITGSTAERPTTNHLTKRGFKQNPPSRPHGPARLSEGTRSATIADYNYGGTVKLAASDSKR